MKKRVIIGLLFALNLTHVTWADSTSLKDEVAAEVRQLISDSKGILSGIQQGISEGRADGESTDQAIIVTDSKTFDKHLKLTISSKMALSGNRYELSVAIKNSSDKPVRLINLGDNQNMILMDKEGFASHLSSGNLFSTSSTSDVTIPAKAGLRVKWVFEEVEGEPALLRIYGKEYSVK